LGLTGPKRVREELGKKRQTVEMWDGTLATLQRLPAWPGWKG
jgi:hypothetical protein